MISANFEQMPALQCQNRSLKNQIEELESGGKYRKMDKEYKAFLRFHDREVERLKNELEKAHRETVTVRKYRGEIMDDLEKEHQKEIQRLLDKINHLDVRVIEYTIKEYQNRKTGACVHAPFPERYVNEVNYDGTVKAFAFLLGNECGVSHGKIRNFLRELTGGEVEISDGMINGLCEEFSAKTEDEKKEIRKN